MYVLFLVFVLMAVSLAGVAFIGYTVWHACRHGEVRRLEFFVFGECVPPATDREIMLWTRGDLCA